MEKFIEKKHILNSSCQTNAFLCQNIQIKFTVKAIESDQK